MSDRHTLHQRLAEAIAREPRIFLSKPALEAAEGDRLREDLGMDSVGLVYLLLTLEDHFELEVEDAEETAETLATWGAVLDLVEARR